MRKIVVLDGYALNPGDLSWDALKEFGEVKVFERTPADEVITRSAGAEIIITNKSLLMADEIAKLPDLKYIGITATGYNVVDLEAAVKRGIVVTNVPAYSTPSVAQLVFAFILEFCHHVQIHSDAVHRGEWSANPDFCFWRSPQIELADKTIGIIGFGNIGRRVAEIASAFGMKIIAASRTRQDAPDMENFEWVDIPELLNRSDIVTLHAPLTSETSGLINRDTLALMKKTAILINTARGPLVVDRDLADALNNDQIAGAALDVLSIEPPPVDNPLLTAKNCLITPHIAWATYEARIRLINVVIKNIKAYLEGHPENVVT